MSNNINIELFGINIHLEKFKSPNVKKYLILYVKLH